MTDLEDTDLELVDEEEDADDSITTAAPRPSVNFAGMVVPGSVEIHNVEHDEPLDETEVRTQPGHVPLNVPATLRAGLDGASQQHPLSPRPAAGVPAAAAGPPTEPEPERDEDDDGVTAQAPAPRLGSAPERAASIGISPTSLAPSTQPRRPVPGDEKLAESVDEPLTRPGIDGVEELLTRPGLGVPLSVRPLPRLDGYANDGDDDQLVTTRGPAAERDDSVTTQAPALSGPMLAGLRASASRGIVDATLDDSTEGTTKKVQKKVRQPADASPADASPADGESGSITTQAPGPLTNILRVIASDPEADEDVAIADEEESAENRTAVMANAPLKRVVAEVLGGASAGGSGAMVAIRPTGPPLTMPQNSHGARGSVAAQLAPSSESGLRVAHASGERAIMGGRDDGRGSGAGRANPTGPHDPRPFAATEVAFLPPQASLHDIELAKGPRYGLLVAIVAAISFVVPVTLFVVLKGRSEEAVSPGVPVPSELASEFQQHDTVPRGKLKGGLVVPASASASGSSSTHKPPSRPPFGRR